MPQFKTLENYAQNIDFEKWNSFSTIQLTTPNKMPPFYWGVGKNAPQDIIESRHLTIDGLAATPMYLHTGDWAHFNFLRYDVTNLAYTVRDAGRAAVIGVGGGRDVLSARTAGFNDVSVIELNPIIVNLHKDPHAYRAYAGIGADPHVKFYVDDARNWFARTTEKFDLIQMSMIDSFAATGSGSFTMAENGLYTVEGWQRFLNALTPAGMFTVSRWHAEGSADETGRIVSLAKVSLWRDGIDNPKDHIYLAGTKTLATLIVSKAPFTREELHALDARSEEMGFEILLHPHRQPVGDVLNGLMNASNEVMLNQFASNQLLDVSAPTDNTPFFFNQLRLKNMGMIVTTYQKNFEEGVVAGNLRATGALLIVTILALFVIIWVLLIPTLQTVKAVSKPLARAGTSYFFFIGLGFMLVEVGLIQRMSIFLGHPVYGLAIGLFSLILFTGLGSFLSLVLPIQHSSKRAVAYVMALVGILVVGSVLWPTVMHTYESMDLWVRATVALIAIAPAALLMGMAFPTGMSLCQDIDQTPAPWFWAVNGAAGVLGSSFAVLLSMNTSISTTILVGAGCYLLLLFPLWTLQRLKKAGTAISV